MNLIYYPPATAGGTDPNPRMFLRPGTYSRPAMVAITLMVLALAINVVTKGGVSKGDSQYNEQIQKSLKTSPAAAPTAPASQPLQLPAAPTKK